MIEFPRSRIDNLAQAKELLAYLHKKRENTNTALKWTHENLKWLADYFRQGDLACFHSGSEEGSEFLWDFTAYARNYGMLIVAESEHSKANYALTYDFEKLFYARSPIKLFKQRNVANHSLNSWMRPAKYSARVRYSFSILSGGLKAVGQIETWHITCKWTANLAMRVSKAGASNAFQSELS